MTDLKQAAEMALQYFEDAHGLEDTEVEIKEALRQALADKPPVKTYCGGKPNYCTPEVIPEVPCKTHPDAPHGFDRNASHNADRYVCECEGWEPVDNAYTKNDTTAGVLHKEWVGLTDDEIVDLAFSVDSYKGLVQAVEAKLKEKNS